MFIRALTRFSPPVALLLQLGAATLVAQAPSRPAEPSLTVHNGGFAVVRETIEIDLTSGTTPVEFSAVTAHLEPSSVILRDPTGSAALRVLEQNYRNDPISQQLLLSLYEGQTIDFLVRENGADRRIPGRIVRSGYVPHREAWQRYGQAYYQRQIMLTSGGTGTAQPIIEVDGELRFSLPGQPIFPALTDDSIMKPTLEWLLESDTPGRRPAELTYVTGGMSWQADYNLIAPRDAGTSGVERIDVSGWVTVDNQSGRTFENARLKLMAGDLNKLQPEGNRAALYSAIGAADSVGGVQVSERSFDEYHLYTTHRRTTLRDRETKQIEFLRAEDVETERLYVYDGAWIDPNRFRGWNDESIRQDRNYGTVSNPKVWVMRQFENTEENGLGVPLPRGRVRFYQQDENGELEFVGENNIDHTPREETVRVFTGNAFDLVGERTQTRYEIDRSGDWLDESFEIKLRNRKQEPVEVRVVEHLYRWVNWEIREASMEWDQTDARTIEFLVTLEPDEERSITYQAHYSW